MSEHRLRIGVFGGTFDPIHNAHCEIARAAERHARLDRVLFVVAAEPPHKLDETLASAEDRFAMVEAAVADEPRWEASHIELDRPGPSYTIDTLCLIETGFPGAELFLIVGYDSLLDLPGWKDPAGILARAHLLVVPRPGRAAEPPAGLRGHYDLLPFKETHLSSTEVRECIIAGRPFDHLVPSAVEDLIRTRELYRDRRADSA